MKTIGLACAFALVATPALACDALEVTGAWIREAPPGAHVMAGYATLRNAGDKPLTLDGVRSADFGSAEVHRTDMEGGHMRMRHEPRLLLEAGATAVLQPGELHLMLFEPRRSLKAGDRATLKFDCGTRSMSTDFTVRAEN
jgi:periplasmic copper chaperone A